MERVLLVLLAATALAGCLTTTGPDSTDRQQHDARQVASHFQEISASQSGGWLLAYIPFQNQSLDGSLFNFTLRLNPTGSSDQPILLIEPERAIRLENGSVTLLIPDFNVVEPHEAVDREWRSSSQSSLSYDGLLIGVASQRSFEFYFSVEDDSEGQRFGLMEPVTLHGNATSTQIDKMPVVAPGPITSADSFQSSFETVAPGWTHMELRADRAQPTGYQKLSFEFANGYSREAAEGYEVGVAFDQFVRRSENVGKLDYYGHFGNDPGTNEVTLTTHETSSSKSVLWMHMEGANLTFAGRPFTQFDYRGWDPDR